MQSSAAARVGAMVIVAFALAGSAWWYFNRLDLGHGTTLRAEFADTKGLQPHTPVRMNGVVVGDVKSIDLDPVTLRPVVTCALATRNGRVPANARIRITSGILITTPQVEIYWLGSPMPGSIADRAVGGRWPEDQVDQTPTSGLAQLSPEADQTVKNLSATVEDLRPRLVITMGQLKGILKRADATMGNFQAASARLNQVVSDRRIDRSIDATLTNLQDSAAQARATAVAFRRKMDEMVRSGGRIDQLSMGAIDLLNKFADTADALRSTVTRLSEQVSDPRLMQSMQETLEMANATLARFNQVAADIHQITGDPSVQSELKSGIATLSEVATEGRQLVDRVSALVNRLPQPGRGPKLGIGRPELGIDFMARGRVPHFRSDVNLRLPVGDRNAVNIGLYDFAETYRLNAQYETRLGSAADLRYGIYAGKLGVGYDWNPIPGTQIRLDAYNPNYFQLDARSLFRINDDFSLWLGADSLLKKPTPLIGVRLTR